MERPVSDTIVRLYIVVGVPISFDFRPETRNEIKKIQWFRIDDLPVDRHDNSKNALGIYANSFYSVIPFVNPIKDFIQTRSGQWMSFTNHVTTPKFHKIFHPQQQHQNKKQKCTPKGRILFRQSSSGGGGASVEVENGGDRFGIIRLARAWQDVHLDWNVILKDL